MKIELLMTGATTSEWLRKGIDDYVARIRHYVPFDLRVLPDVKGRRNMSDTQQRDAEGRQMMQIFDPADIVILLDERGHKYTSRQFAGMIDRRLATGGKGRLIFVIGGPYGVNDSVKARADGMLSLSDMTFSHEMVRVFFVEQLYRAMTIINGLPYHHD